MDNFAKGAFVIISSSLIFIAAQAYQINESLKHQSPTVGEFVAAGAITEPAAKEEALKLLKMRMPVVRVHSGTVEVSGGSLDVSGSHVDVRGSVDVSGDVSIRGPVYTYR